MPMPLLLFLAIFCCILSASGVTAMVVPCPQTIPGVINLTNSVFDQDGIAEIRDCAIIDQLNFFPDVALDQRTVKISGTTIMKLINITASSAKDAKFVFAKSWIVNAGLVVSTQVENFNITFGGTGIAQGTPFFGFANVVIGLVASMEDSTSTLAITHTGLAAEQRGQVFTFDRDASGLGIELAGLRYTSSKVSDTRFLYFSGAASGTVAIRRSRMDGVSPIARFDLMYCNAVGIGNMCSLTSTLDKVSLNVTATEALIMYIGPTTFLAAAGSMAISDSNISLLTTQCNGQIMTVACTTTIHRFSVVRSDVRNEHPASQIQASDDAAASQYATLILADKDGKARTQIDIELEDVRYYAMGSKHAALVMHPGRDSVQSYKMRAHNVVINTTAKMGYSGFAVYVTPVDAPGSMGDRTGFDINITNVDADITGSTTHLAHFSAVSDAVVRLENITARLTSETSGFFSLNGPNAGCRVEVTNVSVSGSATGPVVGLVLGHQVLNSTMDVRAAAVDMLVSPVAVVFGVQGIASNASFSVVDSRVRFVTIHDESIAPDAATQLVGVGVVRQLGSQNYLSLVRVFVDVTANHTGNVILTGSVIGSPEGIKQSMHFALSNCTVRVRTHNVLHVLFTGSSAKVSDMTIMSEDVDAIFTLSETTKMSVSSFSDTGPITGFYSVARRLRLEASWSGANRVAILYCIADTSTDNVIELFDSNITVNRVIPSISPYVVLPDQLSSATFFMSLPALSVVSNTTMRFIRSRAYVRSSFAVAFNVGFQSTSVTMRVEDSVVDLENGGAFGSTAGSTSLAYAIVRSTIRLRQTYNLNGACAFCFQAADTLALSLTVSRSYINVSYGFAPASIAAIFGIPPYNGTLFEVSNARGTAFQLTDSVLNVNTETAATPPCILCFTDSTTLILTLRNTTMTINQDPASGTASSRSLWMSNCYDVSSTVSDIALTVNAPRSTHLAIVVFAFSDRSTAQSSAKVSLTNISVVCDESQSLSSGTILAVSTAGQAFVPITIRNCRVMLRRALLAAPAAPDGMSIAVVNHTRTTVDGTVRFGSIEFSDNEINVSGYLGSIQALQVDLSNPTVTDRGNVSMLRNAVTLSDSGSAVAAPGFPWTVLTERYGGVTTAPGPALSTWSDNVVSVTSSKASGRPVRCAQVARGISFDDWIITLADNTFTNCSTIGTEGAQGSSSAVAVWPAIVLQCNARGERPGYVWMAGAFGIAKPVVLCATPTIQLPPTRTRTSTASVSHSETRSGPSSSVSGPSVSASSTFPTATPSEEGTSSASDSAASHTRSVSSTAESISLSASLPPVELKFRPRHQPTRRGAVGLASVGPTPWLSSDVPHFSIEDLESTSDATRAIDIVTDGTGAEGGLVKPGCSFMVAPTPSTHPVSLAALTQPWPVLRQVIRPTPVSASPSSNATVTIVVVATIVLPSLSAGSVAGAQMVDDLTFSGTFSGDCLVAAKVAATTNLTFVVLAPPPPTTKLLSTAADTTAAVAAVASAAAGSPAAGLAVARVSMIAALTTCEPTLGLPLDFSSSPTGIAITDQPVGYFFGAAVMNTVLILAFVLVVLGVAAARRWRVGWQTCTTAQMLAWGRLPSIALFPTLFVLQPTFAGALTAFVFGSGVAVRGGALLIVLFWVAVVVFFFWRIFRGNRFAARFVAESEEMEEAMKEANVALRFLYKILASIGEWHDTNPKIEFVRANFLFISDFRDRAPWFLFFDVTLSLVLAAIDVYRTSGSGSTCDVLVWITCIGLFALVVAQLLLRPYESMFNLIFSVVIAGGQAVAAVLAILADSIENGQNIVADLLNALLIIVAVRSGYDVLRVGWQFFHNRFVKNLRAKAANMNNPLLLHFDADPALLLMPIDEPPPTASNAVEIATPDERDGATGAPAGAQPPQAEASQSRRPRRNRSLSLTLPVAAARVEAVDPATLERKRSELLAVKAEKKAQSVQRQQRRQASEAQARQLLLTLQQARESTAAIEAAKKMLYEIETLEASATLSFAPPPVSSKESVGRRQREAAVSAAQRERDDEILRNYGFDL
jgi:hypothetical protein